MSENMKSVIDIFAENFDLFKAENRGLIADLKAAIEPALEREPSLDDVDEVLDDYADNLKSVLGANAANAAGDDEEAKESALEEAEEWVAANVSNSVLEDRIAAVLWLDGCDAGAAKLNGLLPKSETVTIRLTLDVTYALNGESASEMASRLQRMCQNAIGDGLLTGYSDAEVEEYSLATAIQPNASSEAPSENATEQD